MRGLLLWGSCYGKRYEPGKWKATGRKRSRMRRLVRKRKERVYTFGEVGFCASTSARRRFISEMQVARRPPASMDSSFPLSHSLSLSKEGSAREVVVERR